MPYVDPVMNLCHECRRPILSAVLVWGSRLVTIRTLSEPAGLDTQPFHRDCLIQQGAAAKAQDLYLLHEAPLSRHVDAGARRLWMSL